MARLLLFHHEPAAREIVKSLAIGHQLDVAKDFAAIRRLLIDSPPDLILVSQDHHQEHAVRLLTWMRDNTRDTPVIVLLGRAASVHKPVLQKLKAACFVEPPLDRTKLSQAIESTLAAARAAAAGPPPVTEEELNSNLSMLESGLNRRMQCFAGRNQVFIQSTLTGAATTRPRICLRCQLRADYGLPRTVYYEFIKTVCCGTPDECEAVRRWTLNRETA